MLSSEVTEGVLKLSWCDREELAAVLFESLRDDAQAVEEIDLDAMAELEAEPADEAGVPSAAAHR